MSQTKSQPGTFCWFECGTKDQAAAKKFYSGVFGWKTVDMPMPGDMPGHYTLLKIGDADIGGLYQLSGPMAGVPSHWMTYVNVQSTDDTTKRARTLGAKVVAEPMDIPGVGRISVLEDPTGAHISLFQPGEHPGAAQLGLTPGTFCWSELATRDTRAAKVFYSELFDWKAKSGQAAPMEYTEFMANGQPIGGMMEMTPQHGDAPPHWLPYVTVEDPDDTAAKVSKFGGQVLVPPMDIPNVGRFSVFMDPTGAAFAVIRLAAH